MRLPSRAALARIAPFAIFMALLIVRSQAADGAWGFDAQWLYGLSVVIAGAVIAVCWREYGELARQTLPNARESLLAIAAGALVFVLWISLDAPWMTIGSASAPFKPADASGAVDIPQVAIRFIGAALLAPLMEGVRAIVLSTFAVGGGDRACRHQRRARRVGACDGQLAILVSAPYNLVSLTRKGIRPWLNGNFRKPKRASVSWCGQRRSTARKPSRCVASRLWWWCRSASTAAFARARRGRASRR
jgi:hypothetical protein